MREGQCIGDVHETEVERSMGALEARPGASDMVPALGTGRPCWNNLPAVASNSKVSKCQARTGASLPSGARDRVGWDIGHPAITGVWGLLASWKDRGTLLEGRTGPGPLRPTSVTGAVPSSGQTHKLTRGDL